MKMFGMNDVTCDEILVNALCDVADEEYIGLRNEDCAKLAEVLKTYANDTDYGYLVRLVGNNMVRNYKFIQYLVNGISELWDIEAKIDINNITKADLEEYKRHVHKWYPNVDVGIKVIMLSETTAIYSGFHWGDDLYYGMCGEMDVMYEKARILRELLDGKGYECAYSLILDEYKRCAKNGDSVKADKCKVYLDKIEEHMLTD